MAHADTFRGRGCSSHYRDLASNAGQLALTLSNLEDLVKKRRLDAAQQIQLLEHGGKCKEVLLAIQEVLREYESLSTKSKKIQDMLGWDYEGARELRDRLTAAVVMLSSFYDTLTLSSMFRLEDAMKRMMRQGQAGQKGADAISILSSHSVESIKTPQAWRLIIQDLEDLGISPDDAHKHRTFIVQWFTKALQDAKTLPLEASGSIPGAPTDAHIFHGPWNMPGSWNAHGKSRNPSGTVSSSPAIGLIKEPSHLEPEPASLGRHTVISQVNVKPRQAKPSKFSVFRRRGIFAREDHEDESFRSEYGDHSNLTREIPKDPEDSSFMTNWGADYYGQLPMKDDCKPGSVSLIPTVPENSSNPSLETSSKADSPVKLTRERGSRASAQTGHWTSALPINDDDPVDQTIQVPAPLNLIETVLQLGSLRAWVESLPEDGDYRENGSGPRA